MAQGTFDEVQGQRRNRPPGQYLSGTQPLPCPQRRTPWLPALERTCAERPTPQAAFRRCHGAAPPQPSTTRLQGAAACVGASGHNLQNGDGGLPVGLLTCVTGRVGLGQIHAGQRHAVRRSGPPAAPRRHANRRRTRPSKGCEYFDKVINVDQAPIGRTPRSNPATYTGLFTPIRELMAETTTARERGYGPGRF